MNADWSFSKVTDQSHQSQTAEPSCQKRQEQKCPASKEQKCSNHFCCLLIFPVLILFEKQEDLWDKSRDVGL